MRESRLVRKVREKGFDELFVFLTPTQKNVFRLRYGFLDGRMWSFVEIAALLNVSRQAAHQANRGALRRIRDRFDPDHF